ncbi:MAG: single-stranded DNA-binding protein, partial [Ignavibacteria bacterium]
WHNIVSFNLSDYFKENLKKGKKFYVEGRISKRDYTDKEGVKRYSTEIISERLIPLEGAAAREENLISPSETQVDADVHVEENEDLPF